MRRYKITLEVVAEDSELPDAASFDLADLSYLNDEGFKGNVTKFNVVELRGRKTKPR